MRSFSRMLTTMPLFTVADVSLNFGSKDVLSHVSASLDAGDRVGLVGPNGAGKTSLLRVVAGEERPGGGQVSLAGGMRLGYVSQIPRVSDDLTVREEVLSGIAHLAELEVAIEQAAHDLTGAAGAAVEASATRYDELSRRFEAEGGYRYRAEAEQILAGLRLPERLWVQPAAGLSGGEKSRIALGRVLLSRPDVLLLDEPTNHLDINGITWLEGFLQRWPGAIVVVSHDRSFLDNIATEIWDLRQKRLTTYRGNYGAYAIQRAERLALQRDQYQRQREHILKEEELIRRYKEGQRAKWALGRQKQLSHIDRIERPHEEASVHIKLGRVARTGRVAIALERLVIAQPGNIGNILLRLPERVEVERGDRVAIVGPNGTGKTTLLRTIMAEHDPENGRVVLGANVRTGYYRQGTDHLETGRTVLDELLATRNMPLQEARDMLAKFLFRGDMIDQPVSTLSGGERSRLALAKLTADDVNVLLLDEPTNHLDIGSREALEQVLTAYQGTILFVTHDRTLIHNLATKTWLVHDGRVTDLNGPALELPESRQPVLLDTPRTEPAPLRDGKTEARELARRAKEVEQLESRVSDAEQRIADLTEELHRATSMQDAHRTGEIGAAYAAAEDQLQQLISAWEAAAQAVEGASAASAKSR
jgi:ATP-binding cassette subfamily F protein 3